MDFVTDPYTSMIVENAGHPTSIPSFALFLNKSRCLQVDALGQFMLPHTRSIRNSQQMLQAMQVFNENNISDFVSKVDESGTTPTCRWSDKSMFQVLQSHIATPIVIQPFLEDYMDLSVFICGDYTEVRERVNDKSWNRSEYAGGRTWPVSLSQSTDEFCREVMSVAKFPFAFLDIFVKRVPFADTPRYYLNKISLTGKTSLAPEEETQMKLSHISKLSKGE